jgi:hypothetical protein
VLCSTLRETDLGPSYMPKGLFSAGAFSSADYINLGKACKSLLLFRFGLESKEVLSIVAKRSSIR